MMVETMTDASTLQAGAILGHYTILAPLGAGGMGEVYLASDSRLKRNVALKILPDAIVKDQSRLRRFTLEAQTASALNHPSIVTIYEIGTSVDGDHQWHYIAMELIEGKTLRELGSNRANLKKLLPQFIDIAEGLSKAHGAGVIHRDLKPENIMITADGRAKIVDFGLAKLVPFEDELHPNDTTVALQTGAGTILGTVGYMSPEQVEARTVDHRSDIFSLGCVLYEALSGARAFSGKSAVDTLHQIVHTDPPRLEEFNSSVPDDLVRVVDRCLAKDPDERFQSVKEVAIELRGVLRQSTDSWITTSRKPVSRVRRRWPFVALGAVLALAAITAAVLLWPRKDTALASYRFTPLETTPHYEGSPSWSPDGKTIAYVAETDGILQIFTRSLTSSRSARITSQPRDCRDPFWSPDSSRIYFISLAGSMDGLWMVGAAGGSPHLVMPNVVTAAITPDGKTLAVIREDQGGGEFSLSLHFATAAGTDVRKFEHPKYGHRTMAAGTLRFTPDGRKLGAWLLMRGRETPHEFWVISLAGEEPVTLPAFTSVQRTYSFTWLPDSRHVIFGGEGPSGTSGSHLWIVDTKSGRTQPITATPANEAHPTLSPDGKRIVFTTAEADFDLLSISLADKSVSPLLATSRAERMPAWSPDGRSYAFVTNRNGTDEVWLRAASGDFERPVVSKSDFPDGQAGLIASVSFSPDGQRVAYQRSLGNYRIWISSINGGAPVPLTHQGLVFEDHPTWSPEGEWIAFVGSSLDAGRGAAPLTKLMKARVGLDTSPVVLVESVLGSGGAKWSPDGAWIACETAAGITLVSADGATRRLLIEDSWLAFDWSKDSKSIFAIRPDEELRVALVRVNIETREEEVMADLGASAPTDHPFQGLSVSPDGKVLATSVVRLRGDLWLLEGWNPTGGLFSGLAEK